MCSDSPVALDFSLDNLLGLHEIRRMTICIDSALIKAHTRSANIMIKLLFESANFKPENASPRNKCQFEGMIVDVQMNLAEETVNDWEREAGCLKVGKIISNISKFEILPQECFGKESADACSTRICHSPENSTHFWIAEKENK